LLYRHTTLIISLDDDDEDDDDQLPLEERSDAWLAALRGLAANSQGQCGHVKRLTVRTAPSQRVAAGGRTSAAPVEVTERAPQEHDEMIDLENQPDAVVSRLLENALRQMDNLMDLE
jgi:hypothetical protein